MDAVWQKRSEIGHDRILGGTDPSNGNAQAARCTGGVTANGWDRILSARLCVVSSYAMALRIRTKAFVILMLTSIAVSLFNTLASIIIPCSVKA